MTTNFMSSSIPEVFSRGLSDDKGLVVGANHTDKIANVLFIATSELLKELKNKEFPAVFRFTDLNGDLIAAAIVKYNANTDAKQPGNWSYIWTFDAADITDGSRIMDNTDTKSYPYFVSTAGSKYHMGFNQQSYISELSTYLLKTISKWLDDNANDKEETVIELEGVFQARCGVEDGKVVKSIEVIGEVKAIIKDDAGIEV